MNLATLRVNGTYQAIQALSNLLKLEVDQMWKKGEPKRRGGCFPTSGFIATIVDANSPREMVVAIREFISDCKARNINFLGSDLSAEVAIGVTVGDTKQFVACVDLSAADLLSLSALGVELSFSAYPTSDEANAELQDA
jgi:hypothetical protein